MLRLIIWTLAGILSVLIVTLAFLPITLLTPFIESQTQGRITLGDAQGTIWKGSAFIGSAPAANSPITPLLPGRFSWQLSPTILLGIVEIELANTSALSAPLHLTGNWRELLISPASITLPAERLASLGAPLNTLRPSGQMRLDWQPLRVSLADGMALLNGRMDLQLIDISSRLSPIKPLGAYNLNLVWQGQQAAVTLKTLQGPLLLDGSGMLNNGRLRFSGTAQAATGQELALANLLNLLGQRRYIAGKDIIALEIQ